MRRVPLHCGLLSSSFFPRRPTGTIPVPILFEMPSSLGFSPSWAIACLCTHEKPLTQTPVKSPLLPPLNFPALSFVRFLLIVCCPGSHRIYKVPKNFSHPCGPFFIFSFLFSLPNSIYQFCSFFSLFFPFPPPINCFCFPPFHWQTNRNPF